jgi:hypothetical protein
VETKEQEQHEEPAKVVIDIVSLPINDLTDQLDRQQLVIETTVPYPLCVVEFGTALDAAHNESQDMEVITVGIDT